MSHLRLCVVKNPFGVTSQVGQGAELKLRTVSRCELTDKVRNLIYTHQSVRAYIHARPEAENDMQLKWSIWA